MSVKYKSSDGWKNISSSSNNAIDIVENGNMHPVTSNAVYDAISPIGDIVTNRLVETTTVTTNYYCNVSITLPKGVWVVTLKGDATKTSSMNWGIWAIRIDTYNGGEAAYLTYPSRSSGQENCRGSVTAIINVTNFSLPVWGNLFTDANVTYESGQCELTAVRIK